MVNQNALHCVVFFMICLYIVDPKQIPRPKHLAFDEIIHQRRIGVFHIQFLRRCEL